MYWSKQRKAGSSQDRERGNWLGAICAWCQPALRSAAGLGLAVLVAIAAPVSSSHAAPLTEQTPPPSALDATFYLNQGAAAFQAGDYGAAVRAFSQVITLDAHNGNGFSNRCLVYLQIQDYDQAIADCDRAIQLKPTNAEAYLNRGLAHYRQRQLAPAIADYSASLRLQSQDYRAYYNRGLAQAEQGDYRAAISDYQSAVQVILPLANPSTSWSGDMPEDDSEASRFDSQSAALLATVYNDRGIAYLMLGQEQAALVDFTRAIDVQPMDVRGWFNRGCAHHRLGQIVAALDDFSQVIARDPAYAQAYLSRGQIRYHQGDVEPGLIDLQTAATLFQDQGAIGNYQQIRRLIERLQAPAPVVG